MTDDSTLTALPTGEPSRAFGNYRLLQRIGEGGMGEVWLAEQLQPVRRQLAIKLIKAGMDTRQVVARFEAERQALALMDHPSIAKVFDGGSTPEGRPYFAMEYVRGEPITAYCERHHSSLRERIDLFLDVCDAVQHAHQKGIIHRDLKPSNVLVETLDGHARPRIIDFGIAKATSQPLTDNTLFTELGVVIGTPEYMSPEQAEFSGRDVDTRTDVYALGTILYELLTGVLPLDVKGARQSGIDEVRRTIRDVQPARPSTRARSSELRGDLDWVVMRALEKDRNRRYGSVSDLAADLRRYLEHQPVVAGPPTIRYRAAKFLRRHRLGASIAAALVILLVGFAVVTAVQARRIAQERDRANLEAETARQVSTFLTGLFTVSDPSEARGNTLTATQILDKGAKDLDATLKDQPELRARLQLTIGNVYMNLGRYSTAQPLLTQALASLTERNGPEDPATLSAAYAVATLYWYLDRIPESERLYSQVVEGRVRALGADHRDTLRAQFDLASTYGQQGRLDDSVRLTSQVLERQRAVLGPEHSDTIETIGNLASLHWRKGDYATALPLAETEVAAHRKLRGPDHPATLAAMHNLATTHDRLSNTAEAEAIYRETILGKQRVLGRGHLVTVQTQLRFAQMLQKAKRYPEAEAQLLTAYDAFGSGGSGASPQRLQGLATQLASLYTEWGKPAKAAEWRAKAPPAPAK